MLKKKRAVQKKKVMKPKSNFFRELELEVKKSQQARNFLGIERLEGVSIKELVDGLIEYAYRAKASDIHIDPMEHVSVVRFRIDGILHDVFIFPAEKQFKVVTRVKVLSELRTDEHSKPLDGRFKVILKDVAIDMRVSIVPTYFGENIVIRLLVGQARALLLEELGFVGNDLERIERNIKKSYGMILASGPTGAGKTTTLYSILDILNKRERSIITIEDPIEYTVSGVTQIQVNNRQELTFARGLRAIVRQDPNIIMVGEIRDEETANIAVNAAMTGHLLLSSLHTNSAAVSLPRLLDMGIEPFLITSTINVVIGQRLMRRLCQACIQKNKVSAMEKKSFASVVSAKDLALLENSYTSEGCSECNGTGYKGRIGIYEVLEMTENIKHLIMQRQNAVQIQKAAIEEGMTTMIADGLKKASQGLTSVVEVLRVIHE